MTDRQIKVFKLLKKWLRYITILLLCHNIGVSIAKGEFIWFVDSDDWIEENCLNELYLQCKTNELDMLLMEFNCFVGGQFKIFRTLSNENVDKYIHGKIYLLSHELQLSPWCYIFRRDFLIQNQLFFMNHIFHEDNELIPRIFYFAKRFMTINKAFYYEFPNPTSTTRGLNPKRSFDLLKVAQSHVSFVDNVVTEKEIKTVIYGLIGLAINSALCNSKSMNNENMKKFYLELNQNKHLFYYMKQSNSIKYKLEAILYLFSPKLFRKLYSVLS
jgi:glycosyltransferase involved in cell wall biosynthesis